MDKEIYCYKCNDYLGVIRDTKLKKNMYFVCYDCVVPKPKYKTKDYDMPDIFKDIFKM